MSETGRERVIRPDDGFERLDAAIGRIEAGLLTFAMLAMALSFFVKIVYDNAVAERNFVDQLLLRWLHDGPGPVPAALVQEVHGVWSPVLLVVGLWVVCTAAVRTVLGRAGGPQAGEPAGSGTGRSLTWTWRQAALGFALSAAVAGGIFAIVVVPPRVLCALIYFMFLAGFARRAQRRGEGLPFAAAWTVLTLPIGALIWRIPEQYAWVNDLGKILIMYIGFLGASLATREKKHVVLNFGRRAWPASMIRGFEAANLSITLGFLILLCALAGHLFALQWHGGSRLAILWVPEYHVVLPVVLALALMALRVAADLIRVVTGRPLARVEVDLASSPSEATS